MATCKSTNQVAWFQEMVLSLDLESSTLFSGTAAHFYSLLLGKLQTN